MYARFGGPSSSSTTSTRRIACRCCSSTPSRAELRRCACCWSRSARRRGTADRRGRAGILDAAPARARTPKLARLDRDAPRRCQAARGRDAGRRRGAHLRQHAGQPALPRGVAGPASRTRGRPPPPPSRSSTSLRGKRDVILDSGFFDRRRRATARALLEARGRRATRSTPGSSRPRRGTTRRRSRRASTRPRAPACSPSARAVPASRRRSVREVLYRELPGGAPPSPPRRGRRRGQFASRNTLDGAAALLHGVRPSRAWRGRPSTSSARCPGPSRRRAAPWP